MIPGLDTEYYITTIINLLDQIKVDILFEYYDSEKEQMLSELHNKLDGIYNLQKERLNYAVPVKYIEIVPKRDKA